MKSERERQLLAYRRAQGCVGAEVEETSPPVKDEAEQAKTDSLLRDDVPLPVPVKLSQRVDPISLAGSEIPPVAFPSVDPHWLQVKLRQLNVPALRVLLAQLPSSLQRLLLPQLEKSVAAELLKRARPAQRRELLRGGRECDAKLFDELGFYYQHIFASECPHVGQKRLAAICRYLPLQHQKYLGQSEKVIKNDDWRGSPALRRMVRRLDGRERALLVGHPGMGHAVLEMLSPEERLSCLAELICLADLPAHQRRRRLRRLLLRSMSATTVSDEAETRRVGV